MTYSDYASGALTLAERSGPSSDALPWVETDWLAEHLGDPAVRIFDATVHLATAAFDGDYRAVSGHDSWLAGHIPGSVHADLLGALSDPASPLGFALPVPDRLVEALKALGVEDSSHVVVYDADGGIWAARIWWMLRSLGITVSVLNGGWGRWVSESRPVETGPVTIKPSSRLAVRLQNGYWVEREKFQAILAGRHEATLVCALSSDAFHGRVPTRYSRRGHIPGSLNLPARSLTAEDGRYRSTQELRHAVKAVLPDPEAPIVLYCGGGIAACVLALVLTHLGYRRISVYDGSLQEWSAIPDLPLDAGRG